MDNIITDIRPLSQEEHDEAIERMRSYDALPETECVEKLRAEVRGFERRILAITGDPLETCWWDTVKPENISGYVDDLIGLRYFALMRLFEILCTEAEMRRIERVNARLLEMTREMFERTGQVYRHFLDMPHDRNEEDIEVEGTLKYWEDIEALRLEDDDFYGSDFRHIIPVIAYIDSLRHGDLPIISCRPDYDPDRRFNSSMSDRELGIVNNLDEGVTASPAEIVGCCLWHTSFYGFLPEDVNDTFISWHEGKGKTKYYIEKFKDILPTRREMLSVPSFHQTIRREMRIHMKYRSSKELSGIRALFGGDTRKWR